MYETVGGLRTNAINLNRLASGILEALADKQFKNEMKVDGSLLQELATRFPPMGEADEAAEFLAWVSDLTQLRVDAVE